MADCVQPRTSAVNMTLPAFTAERRRLLHGSVDRYLLPANSGVARIWMWGAQGVWRTEVPQRGPGAEPLVGGSGGHSLPKAHSSY